MKRKKNNWPIVFLLLIIVVVSLIIALWKEEDPGEYDYCISYSGEINETTIDINRNNMVTNCYNFVESKIICTFIANDNQLTIQTVDNPPRSLVFNCSRKVKSIFLGE